MISPGASIIELRGVSHAAHASPEGESASLRGISCAFARGEVSLVRGAVEEGRRTLFRLLGLFELPEEGDLFFQGETVRGWSEIQRAEFRMHHLGQILAAPFLLAGLSAAENVAMPLFKLINLSEGEAAERTETLLTFTGLSGLGPAVAGDLSLEDQYRVALARALAHQPDLLLVEDLDGRLAGEPLRRISLLLREAAEQFELTVIAGGSAALPPEGAARVLDLAGGHFVSDTAAPLRVPLEQ